MVVTNRHMKIKKLSVNFIIKIDLIENECKTTYGCLTLIFYQKYFMIKCVQAFSCSGDKIQKPLLQESLAGVWHMHMLDSVKKLC